VWKLKLGHDRRATPATVSREQQTATHPELKHNLKFGTANNSINGKVVVDPLVAFQRRDDGCGVGQTRRLEHDGVELLPLLDESAQCSHQITSDGATRAAVVHLY